MAGKADAWRQQTSSSTTCTLSCRYGTRQAKKSLTACGPFHTVRITPRRASRRDLTWCTDATQPADDTDLIMLCYSVESKDSLENVESKWVGEIADNCPGVKLVLVALKCDLREQGGEDELRGCSHVEPCKYHRACRTRDGKTRKPRENRGIIVQ